MKSGRNGLAATILRISFAGVFFVFGGTNPALIGSSFLRVGEASGNPVEDVNKSLDDEFDQESPILELDPERKYRSEALLSYKSTLAPYGKIVGIRSVNATTFTSVQTWKDVEDFVKGIAEDRIIVKLLEPWGSEIVSSVTVNRKAYPASVIRPAMDPPKTESAADKPKPVEKPKPEPQKQDQKPVVLTNLTAKAEPKSALTPSDPTAKPETSKPAASRSESASPTTVRSGPRLIEPSTRSMSARAELDPSKPRPQSAASKPKDTRISSVQPVPRGAAPRFIEPNAPLRSATAKAELKPSKPQSNATSGKPAMARNSSGPSSSSVGTPRIIEPNAAVVTWADSYELMLLFAAPFMPREVKSAPEASKAPNHLVASALPRSGMGSYVRVIKSPSVEPAHVEDANWLQEAIDLADKLGILSCKPVITADRRQRAFALYTLYMGLQDLRSEVDRNAVRLNSALERISGTDQPRPADLKDVVALGRSYERGMTAILRWDAETMKHVVRDYVSELQTMDNVRSMLTFLAGIKREPKLVANLRTIPGLEVLEE